MIKCPYCNHENKVSNTERADGAIRCYRCRDKIILDDLVLEPKEVF